MGLLCLDIIGLKEGIYMNITIAGTGYVGLVTVFVRRCWTPNYLL